MANNLVAATCPNCNSPLQIKEGQDFVKCEYCGTISSAPKAIEYHQHQNTNYNFSGENAVVNFNNGQDLETLVKNADMHLKLKNYADAQSIYEKISKEYPHDYRGWWGMILSLTKNLEETNYFTKPGFSSGTFSYCDYFNNDYSEGAIGLSDEYNKIKLAWKNVQTLAPQKLKDELSNRFQPFYDLSYARYEKNYYTQIIPFYNDEIRSKEIEISETKEQISSTERAMKNAKSYIPSNIARVVGHAFLGIVLGALSVFFIEKAFTLLFSAQIFFGICLAGLAVPCVIYFFKQRGEIKDGYNNIKSCKRSIPEYSSEIREMNEKIKKTNDEIIKIQEEIKTAKVNLKKTNEKIAEFEKKMSK